MIKILVQKLMVYEETYQDLMELRILQQKEDPLNMHTLFEWMSKIRDS